MQKFFLLFLTFIISNAALSQVHVRGYFRKDGTYVRPHYRSNPDNNIYNNWSANEDVDSYIDSNRKPTINSGSLRKYYSQLHSNVPAYNYKTSAPPVLHSWELPLAIEKLPSLPQNIAEEDIQRANMYCRWLYTRDTNSVKRCQLQQKQMLTRVVLPDYSDLPKNELRRSSGYCEWLYGDNRASFYDCFNTQSYGLSKGEARFGSVPNHEVIRAKKYCEWLYGNNRASYYNCLESQAFELQKHLPIFADDLPSTEWTRAVKYCEWLYGDNRGSAASCYDSQANSIRAHIRQGAMKLSFSSDTKNYCEWLYGDNRSSYWSCVVSR